MFDFLTGLWPLVRNYSIGGGVVAACVAYYLFAPALLTAFIDKKWAVRIAAAAIIILSSYTAGVVNEKARWEAREKAAAENGEAIRQEIDRTPQPQPDTGFLRRFAKPDKFDRR